MEKYEFWNGTSSRNGKMVSTYEIVRRGLFNETIYRIPKEFGDMIHENGYEKYIEDMILKITKDLKKNIICEIEDIC